jgi:hypothetical protein
MLFSAYVSFTSLAHTLASYHIGSNTVEFKGMPSFTEANSCFPLDQGKHRASSLYRVSLYNIYIMLMIVYIHIEI